MKNEKTEIKRHYRVLYKNIVSVYSPVLMNNVNFNSKGFNHLIYKNARNERNKIDQSNRLKLIPLAHELIKISTTFQEFEVSENLTRYWGLIAILGNTKIRVIIRQKNHGCLHFWIVIPNWSTQKRRDEKRQNKKPSSKWEHFISACLQLV